MRFGLTMKYNFMSPPPKVGEGQGNTRTYDGADIHMDLTA